MSLKKCFFYILLLLLFDCNKDFITEIDLEKKVSEGVIRQKEIKGVLTKEPVFYLIKTGSGFKNMMIHFTDLSAELSVSLQESNFWFPKVWSCKIQKDGSCQIHINYKNEKHYIVKVYKKANHYEKNIAYNLFIGVRY
ncbi:hypothetical protein AB3N58_05490 [Leptospira sp. WS60.C2]